MKSRVCKKKTATAFFLPACKHTLTDAHVGISDYNDVGKCVLALRHQRAAIGCVCVQYVCVRCVCVCKCGHQRALHRRAAIGPRRRGVAHYYFIIKFIILCIKFYYILGGELYVLDASAPRPNRRGLVHLHPPPPPPPPPPHPPPPPRRAHNCQLPQVLYANRKFG
jgi:hypothetical protein